MASRQSMGIDVHVRTYGRKGTALLPRRGWKLDASITDWASKPRLELVRDLVDEMVAGFVDHKYDEVWIASNEWVSTLVQKPRFQKVLPLVVEQKGEESGGGLDYRYEPSAPQIVGALLPLYIRTIALQALLETIAGEFASRMTAMDSATRNANDLISSLTLVYNRARQAAITKELIEIVSGASAL
jgi:F-type H+-transporting ATPase subunit gamma